MAKITYKDKKFRSSALIIIQSANEIIYEYAQQGFILTLRQLYYQFVARGLLENTDRSYKRLGSIINDARMAGLIDWRAIEDRTRWLREEPHWDNPAEIIRDCVDQFSVDMWKNQAYRPEVWIEKDALIGVIQGVCTELDVPYFACRGYVSQSEQWRAGQRYNEYMKAGKCPIVFHLGDHDPSGIDMTRDNQDRLTMFTVFAKNEVPFPVIRLALNVDQVRRYNPPPNPTKLTDSRAQSYLSKYGDECWELDALEPSIIANLIRTDIEHLIDKKKWAASLRKQKAGRRQLRKLAKEM